ncbi:MAG: CRISPR system precrRNA processing endoribonuclease RAMP protein Cas6 [Bacillota bacterium]|uniref:CRISPR system precrRNA processing endoribonuclease RAMP protein Cas6 n=1 Tax=Desulforamulus profundi TaxID=1383067 RepID=UPI001A9A32EF
MVRTHPEHARQVNLLAGFAFYAGVGQKTTMGMGQCMQSRVWNPDVLLREVGK